MTNGGPFDRLRSLNQRRMAGHPLHAIHARHPRFREAVLKDAKVSAAFRGERHEFTDDRDAACQALRLAWVSDAYFAQVLYRAKASMQAAGVPILPRMAHHLAMVVAQVCIGDPVVIAPGLYLPHGQVVIDGVTVLEGGVTVRPWVTIGLKEGDFNGPTIEAGVQIGTGAKVVGPVRVGRQSLVGANAVVTSDIPAHSVAVGIPAKVRRSLKTAG